MSGERNKQKLMQTRTGQVIPKPPIRHHLRGGRSGSSWAFPVEDRRRRDRTIWMSIADLFKGRR